MIFADATELQVIMFAFRQHAFGLRARGSHCVFSFVLALLALHSPLHSQENYFVTYSHEMEEPGNLEFAAKSVTGAPKGGDDFLATALEFEYGIKTWWTTEL